MEVTVDGYSAWLVVAVLKQWRIQKRPQKTGGFLMQLLIIGYMKSLGIIMMEFQLYFRCTNAVIMAVTASNCSLISLLAPFQRMVMQKIASMRYIVMLSGITCCLLMLLLFCLFNFNLWIACLGLGLGVCLSASYSPVICKVSECFERRRDLATGVCFAGSSLGGMLVPFVFTRITAEFSVAGCCLLIGAFFLHLVVVGTLMPSCVSRPDGGMSQREESRFGSTFSDMVVPVAGEDAAIAKSGGLKSRQKRLLCVFICSSSFANFGFTGQYLTFPMLSAEYEIPKNWIAMLLACQALIDMILRLGVGWFTDRFNWRRSSVMICGMTMMGVACILTVVVTNRMPQWQLPILFAYAAVSGAAGGVYIAMTTSVLVSFVGINNLGLSHSLMCCFWAFTAFPGHTGLGYLADMTGTFWYSMATAGLAMIVASCILAVEHLVDGRDTTMKFEFDNNRTHDSQNAAEKLMNCDNSI